MPGPNDLHLAEDARSSSASSPIRSPDGDLPRATGFAPQNRAGVCYSQVDRNSNNRALPKENTMAQEPTLFTPHDQTVMRLIELSLDTPDDAGTMQPRGRGIVS